MRSRTYGLYVLALLASANFLNYGTRNVVFTMYDDLRGAFHFSNSELGLLGTVFMVGHALVSIPVGWAADRLDRRKTIAVGMLVWSTATLGAAVATGIGTLLVARLLAGIGTAACVPVANALLCDVFPAAGKARTVSIFNLGLFAGGAAGFALGALAGFPLAFVVIAAPGFALLILIWRLDVPGRTREAAGLPVSLRAFVNDVGSLLAIPTMRWVLGGAVLMAFAAGGMLAWFADFVHKTKGMSLERATAVFGACAVSGGLAGVVTGGIIGDRLQRRLPFGRMATMTIGFTAALPFGLAAIFVDGGPVFYAATWLTMFFITWYHGPMAAVVDDLVPEGRAATAQAAFIFTMHLVGTAPSSYAVGLLVNRVGVRYALLAPLVAVAAAALVVSLGFRHAARDCAITAPT